MVGSPSPTTPFTTPASTNTPAISSGVPLAKKLEPVAVIMFEVRNDSLLRDRWRQDRDSIARGLTSQPLRKPARRNPAASTGHARINRQTKSDR